ncbi:MAG TPA: hypothetical protein VGO80_19020 [Solirubrobacteraceae bacterium]|nr:hypothetical protein [Solirubrobacteraceae bacterium]
MSPRLPSVSPMRSPRFAGSVGCAGQRTTTCRLRGELARLVRRDRADTELDERRLGRKQFVNHVTYRVATLATTTDTEPFGSKMSAGPIRALSASGDEKTGAAHEAPRDMRFDSTATVA